ncbi:MAG: ASCH domain-containing protein [Archaeoglobaceae archaeon]|nr:ASCH domain-containing protein [Archaeoglobaceae archaeon]
MMDRINFDPQFIPFILSGVKKTTIRKGIRSYPVGEIVELVVDNKPFALARIKKVVVKRVSEINEDDAKADGFKNREEVIGTLKRIYADLNDSEFVTIVHFDVIS